MQNKSLKMENLVVFDFDNTLIDGNTDSVIIDMFPDLKTTARTYQSEGKGWGETMHLILDKISGKHGRTREDINSCIYQLEIPKTVKRMFSRLVNFEKSDMIIVSYSNECFIDILLNMADIDKSTFKNILTYPAVWTDKGSLKVQRFHSHVIDCEYCPNDFCKGHVLSDAIKKLEEAQRKNYLTKIYIGDGTADYCGAASLNRDDYVLCREGYSLQKLILKHQNHLYKNDSSQNFPKCKSWNTFEEMEANLLSLFAKAS